MNAETGHLGNGSPGLRERLIEFVLTRRSIAFAFGLALVFALGAGIPKITANFTHTAFFKEGDPLLDDFNRFERQYGNDDAIIVVVHSPSGIFDIDSASLLHELTEKMWHIPDIIRVDSLSNYSWVHSIEDDIEVEPLIPDEEPLTESILEERKNVALNHEVLPDYLVSRDGTTALIYARTRPGFESPPDNGVIVNETRTLLSELGRSDHSFHITGNPAINNAFREVSQQDSFTLTPIVLLMAIIFLIFLLRSIGGVVLPLVVILFTVIAAFGIAGWLAVEVTAITIVLPQILIAVGIADSVHILSSFYRARRRNLAKFAAARYTLTKNFVPTILTSLSTAAGFFAFSTSNLKPILGLGVLAGCGTIVAWFATYLLVGPLMVWAPSWVRATGEASELKTPGPRILRYTELVRRHRWKIIGLYSALIVGAFAIATTNTVNSDPYKYFSEKYPLRKAQDFILDHLDGLAGFEMSISSGESEGAKSPEFLRKVEEFQNRLIEIPGVSKAVSLVDVFKQTNRSLNGDRQEEYRLPDSRDLIAQEFFLYTMSLPQGMDVNDRITVNNDAIRVTMISVITESSRWTATAEKFKEIAGELGLDITVSGKTMLYQSMNGYVTRSFIQSLVIAILVVSLILIIAFRSVRLGALAMLPNLIPLIIGGAVLKLIGQTLDIGTMLVSSVCLGIAVDDTIHILTNYHRHRGDGHAPGYAVALTFTHTGPALVVTTLVLVAAFGTLAFATFIPNVFFGVMTAVILTTALITDLTFLPAILMARDVRGDAPLPAAQAIDVEPS